MRRFLKKLITPAFLILLIAFLARLGFLVYYFEFSENFQSMQYIPTADRRHYDSMATSFLKGYGLNWYNIALAHFPPIYPIFLAFLYSFLGHSYYSYLAVFLIQAFLSSIGVVFVFLIGRKIFNPLVGLIAGLIASFYLPFITVVSDLELENLVIFMPLLFFFLLIRINKKPTLWSEISVGVIMALTILTKGIFLFVLPLIVLVWIIITFKTKKIFKTIAVIYLSCGLILAIFLGRNYLIFKKLIFSSQSGASLWIATHPSYGTYNREVSRIFFLEYSELNEAEKNDLYAKKAIDNLKKYPGLYLRRVIKNWKQLFYRSPSDKISIWLAFLASIGLVLALIKKNRRALTLFLFFILFLSQYSLLFTYTRFRMPLDWILILLAAYALSYPIKHLISPKFKKYLKIKDQKNLISIQRWGLIVMVILFAQFLTKIALVYFFPKKQNFLTIDEKLSYKEVCNYQQENQGNIAPFLNKKIIWQGEINYLNHNVIYPLGDAHNPNKSKNLQYKDFYDIYYSLSTDYSTFDLILNRGKKPRFYGDGVVMVNYKGSLLNRVKNGDMITVSGKIIGQNFIGQIYLEIEEIHKID